MGDDEDDEDEDDETLESRRRSSRYTETVESVSCSGAPPSHHVFAQEQPEASVTKRGGKNTQHAQEL